MNKNRKTRIRKICSHETILYLFYGILTTVVNYTVFSFCYYIIFQGNTSIAANAIAFMFAVAFAYVTNKLFVFESKSWAMDVIKKELVSFVSARLASFLLEEAGLFVCDVLLHLDKVSICTVGNIVVDGVMVSKIVLSVVVVIINYIFCKFIIFRNKKDIGGKVE